MNKVILTGRLTRDPEKRLTQGGLETSNFSLACNGEHVDKDGNREVEFIDCVAFQKKAEVINQYCIKGDLILIHGRMKRSSYTNKEGVKKYSTYVIVENIEFLNNKKKGESNIAPLEEKANEEINDPYTEFGEEYTADAIELPF